MPGRRLTGTDRRQIATGLAQGLNHAEIARRLGRPTSTISREIARNGGPGRYRADLAELATSQRARRRPHRAMAPPPRESTGPAPEPVAAVVRDLTAAFVATGVPRTASGILACLYTSESGSATAGELAQYLAVSAATVSHAVKLLEQQGLLSRGRDDNTRRRRYFVDGSDAGYRTVLASARTNQRLAASALRGAETFGPDTPVGARLTAAAQFLEHIGNAVIRSAEQWRSTADEHFGHPTATVAIDGSRSAV